MPRQAIQDPLAGYNFRVSVPGIPDECGFTKVGGLVKELNVATYDEGGYKTTRKIKGKSKTGEVVLSKGLFPNKELQDVFKTAVDKTDYRLTVVIDLLDADNNVARTWTLLEAWCNKWETTDIDASADSIIVETLTFQYEDIEM